MLSLLRKLLITAIVYQSLNLVSSQCPDVTNICCTNILGYDLSSLVNQSINQSVDLTYRNWENGQFQDYYAQPCGTVNQSACETGSSLCRVSADGQSISNITWPSSINAHFEYLQAGDEIGLQIWWQSQASSLSYSATLVRAEFWCDVNQSTTVLRSAAWFEPDTFQFSFLSPLVCGPGDRSSPRPMPVSTLSSCVAYDGAGYDAQLCPRMAGSYAYQPINQSNRADVIENYSAFDAYPFELMRYDVSERFFYSRNGAVFFTFAGVHATQPLIDADFYGQMTSYMPMVAGLFSNNLTRQSTIGQTYMSQVYISKEGSNTNRFVLLRYENLRWGFESQWNDRRISFDIVVHESYPGDIEVHFYRVAPSQSAPVTIGMQGIDVNVRTRVHTAAPINQTFADQLQGSTLTFRRLPPQESACVSHGVDFGSIFTTDAVFTNVTTNTTWFVNPCKQLSTASSMCNDGARYSSVCKQAWNNTLQAEQAVGIIYPTIKLISWSPLPSSLGVRSISTAGHYDESHQCSRSLVIDWICKRGAASNIVSISEGCVTNITIESDAVCAASCLCGSLDTVQYPNQLVCGGAASNASLSSPTAVLQGVDDGAVEVNLPFSIGAGGLNYSSIWISTNGALSFGSKGFTSVSTDDVDDSSSFLIAALMTNLTLTNTGSITYSTENVNGESVFVVRYDVSYADDPSLSVKFDVKLSRASNSTGKVEIVYWHVPMINNLRYSVGFLPANNQSSTVMYANNSLLVTNSSLHFTRAVISFTFDSTVLAEVGSCMALGYDLSALAARDLHLRYFDQDYQEYHQLYVRHCGAVVTSPICANDPLTVSSSVCSILPSGPSTWGARNLGVWNKTEIVHQYPATDDGVTSALQTGSILIDNYPAYVKFIYVCDMSAKRAVISDRVFAPMDNYYLTIRTVLVCGPGSINRTLPQPVSTLQECLEFPGKGYQARLCPRNSSSDGYEPLTLTNPLPVPVPTSMYSAPISLVMYEQVRPMIMYSAGILWASFAPPTPLTSAPGYGFMGRPLFPAFHSTLTSWQQDGWTMPSSHVYSVEGQAPNRQYIIRTTNFRYEHDKKLNNRGMSFDVVINEAYPSDIEVRYYRIRPSAGVPVTIGIQGDTSLDSNTRILTVAALNDTFVSQLQGATLRFSYTPPEASNCEQYGIDFATLLPSDVTLNISKGANPIYDITQWNINPCRRLNLPMSPCDRLAPRSSVCKEEWINSTYMVTSLAVPSQRYPTWSQAPSALGVRSTFMSAYCPEGNKMHEMYFDWVCNFTATTSSVSRAITTSPCTHVVTIQSATVCSLPSLCSSLDNMQFWSKRVCPSAPRVITQSSPTSLPNNAAVRVALPFIISAGSRNHSSVWISSQGSISFGSSPFTSASLVDVNASTTSLVIAGFLTNLTSNGTITYSIEVINNNVTFIVSFDTAYAINASRRVVFDILLTNSSRAEIVYHQIDHVADAPITIGVYDLMSPVPDSGMPPMPWDPQVPQVKSSFYAKDSRLSAQSASLVSSSSVNLIWNSTVTQASFPEPPAESSTGVSSSSSSTGTDSSSVTSSSVSSSSSSVTSSTISSSSSSSDVTAVSSPSLTSQSAVSSSSTSDSTASSTSSNIVSTSSTTSQPSVSSSSSSILSSVTSSPLSSSSSSTSQSSVSSSSSSDSASSSTSSSSSSSSSSTNDVSSSSPNSQSSSMSSSPSSGSSSSSSSSSDMNPTSPSSLTSHSALSSSSSSNSSSSSSPVGSSTSSPSQPAPSSSSSSNSGSPSAASSSSGVSSAPSTNVTSSSSSSISSSASPSISSSSSSNSTLESSSSLVNTTSSTGESDPEVPVELEDEKTAASLNGGAVVGIVIGITAGVAICVIVAVAVFGVRKRKPIGATSSGEITLPVVKDLESGF